VVHVPPGEVFSIGRYLRGGVVSYRGLSPAEQRESTLPPPSLRQAIKRYTIVADGYVDVTSVNRSAMVKTIITIEAIDVQATDGGL